MSTFTPTSTFPICEKSPVSVFTAWLQLLNSLFRWRQWIIAGMACSCLVQILISEWTEWLVKLMAEQHAKWIVGLNFLVSFKSTDNLLQPQSVPLRDREKPVGSFHIGDGVNFFDLKEWSGPFYDAHQLGIRLNFDQTSLAPLHQTYLWTREDRAGFTSPSCWAHSLWITRPPAPPKTYLNARCIDFGPVFRVLCNRTAQFHCMDVWFDPISSIPHSCEAACPHSFMCTQPKPQPQFKASLHRAQVCTEDFNKAEFWMQHTCLLATESMDTEGSAPLSWCYPMNRPGQPYGSGLLLTQTKKIRPTGLAWFWSGQLSGQDHLEHSQFQSTARWLDSFLVPSPWPRRNLRTNMNTIEYHILEKLLYTEKCSGCLLCFALDVPPPPAQITKNTTRVTLIPPLHVRRTGPRLSWQHKDQWGAPLVLTSTSDTHFGAVWFM